MFPRPFHHSFPLSVYLIPHSLRMCCFKQNHNWTNRCFVSASSCNITSIAISTAINVWGKNSGIFVWWMQKRIVKMKNSGNQNSLYYEYKRRTKTITWNMPSMIVCVSVCCLYALFNKQQFQQYIIKKVKFYCLLVTFLPIHSLENGTTTTSRTNDTKYVFKKTKTCRFPQFVPIWTRLAYCWWAFVYDFFRQTQHQQPNKMMEKRGEKH